MAAQEISCPVCDKEVEANSCFCEVCGTPLKGEGPDDVKHLLNQLERLTRTDRKDKVQEIAEVVAERGGVKCHFYILIAEYFLKYEDFQGAFYWFDRGLEKSPTVIDRLEIHQKKGYFYKNQGNLEEAEIEIKQALDALKQGNRKPPPPETWVGVTNLVMSIVGGPTIDTWKYYSKEKGKALKEAISGICTTKAENMRARVEQLMSEHNYRDALAEINVLNEYIKGNHQENRKYINGGNMRNTANLIKWGEKTEKALMKKLEAGDSTS